MNQGNEHKDFYSIPNRKGKRNATVFTSLMLAGALMLGGAKVASHYSKKPAVPENNTTSVSSNVSESSLVLLEDFDINNKEQVKARAEAIYGYSEKKVSVFDIQNIIYMVNGKYENFTFPNNLDDTEKFKYINSLIATKLTEILDDNIFDDEDIQIKLLAGNKAYTLKDDQEIYGYMFMVGGEDKKKMIDFAKIVDEQLKNIEQAKTENFESVARKYYEKYNEFKKTKFTDGGASLIFKDFGTKNGLFTNILSKQEKKILDENYFKTYANKVGFALIDYFKINTQGITDEGLADGFGKPITNMEEKYKNEDKDLAKENVKEDNENLNKESTTKNVGGGDQKVTEGPGKVETITGTTSTQIDESVVEIPSSGEHTEINTGGSIIDESVVSVSGTGEHTEKESGGQVVGEEEIKYVDKDLSTAKGLAAVGSLSFTTGSAGNILSLIKRKRK